MNKGVCPVCNGTTRMPTPDNLRPYAEKKGWYGYRKEDDCVSCTNCGTQYMFGKATGEVRLREDGMPCVHQYTGTTVGRCLTQYTCRHCGDRHQIDSGD
jgi:hypothetical protein